MFLIIGYGDEPTIKHFFGYLSADDSGYSYEFLNLCEVQDTDTDPVDISFTDDLMVRISGKEFDFRKFDSVYSRCFMRTNDNRTENKNLRNLVHLLLNYLDSCDKMVVNRPGAGSSNYSKLLHAEKLAGFGFLTPTTYIFGSKTAAKNTLALDGSWISKGASSVRTRAVEFDFSLYVNLDLLERAPSLFQKRIEGFDVRVHLIGDKFYPLKILSENLDYRYQTGENRYEEIDFPPELGQKCRDFCRSEGLLFAGIDFKVDADQSWHLLEINPMPGYNFFDKKMNNNLSKALAEFLNSGSPKKELTPNNYPVDRPFISKNRRTMN
jgi:glutathione synthase/RimK-type ligase-like ATP-grasp enzyme